MRYIKTYETYSINESFIIPPFIKDIVKRIGDYSLLSKVGIAIKNLPKDVDEAFDYLCNLFNVDVDKEGFMNILRKEKVIKESWKSVIFVTILFIAMFLVYAFFGWNLGKLYEEDSEEFLKSQGFSDIEMIGWSPVAQRDEDITAIDFTAIDRDSNRVEGVVIVGGSILIDEVNFQVKIKKSKSLK